jgi:hypothetical protein
MQKEMMVFFVLQLSEMLLVVRKVCRILKYSYLIIYSIGIQFSVSGTGFSVLDSAPANFNSLY